MSVNAVIKTKKRQQRWTQLCSSRRMEYLLMVLATLAILQTFMFPFRLTLYQTEISIIESSNIQFALQRKPRLSNALCTRLINDNPFNTTDFQDPYRGISVYPKSKLILCIPAKAGTTLDFEIRQELNQLLPESHQIIPWSINEIVAMNHRKSFYFCNESWTKIFIVRDPLARLLSGYLDKCTESIRTFAAMDISHSKSYHIECEEYLLSLGIDTQWIMQHPQEYIADPVQFRGNSDRNNIGVFAQFLVQKTRENKFGSKNGENRYKLQNGNNNDENGNDSILHHFGLLQHYGGIQDSDQLIRGWNVWGLKDKATWDWIFRKQVGSDGNTTLLQHWFDVRDQWNLDPLSADQVVGTRDGDKNMLDYYRNGDMLYFALQYVWRDYFVFNMRLPEWICNLVQSKSRNDLKQFLRIYFVHKRYLLPQCVRNVYAE